MGEKFKEVSARKERRTKMSEERKKDLRRALGLEEPGLSKEGEGRGRKWFRIKINWGFWLLLGGFVLWVVTWFIIRPRIGG